jgi:hypothetical protein
MNLLEIFGGRNLRLPLTISIVDFVSKRGEEQRARQREKGTSRGTYIEVFCTWDNKFVAVAFIRSINFMVDE